MYVLGVFSWVKPQLYADNLKCVSSDGDDMLAAARLTDLYISLVCQTPAPCKCVLLSTSVVLRGLMKDLDACLLARTLVCHGAIT